MSVIVSNISKLYGAQKAVDSLSFEANKGEILGFLGPNGAGKSTTMKMIAGFLKPDHGSIQVEGIEVDINNIKSKSLIGFLPESNPLYYNMYVREFLQFVCKIHKLNNTKAIINNVIEQTGLVKEQNKLIGALSKGYKQRVGLAQAIVHNPAVLILDEPTSGLDMNQLVDIRNLILDLGKEKTVIFSTHIMQEVQALCDRVIVINEGKLVANDSIEKLQSHFIGEKQIVVEFLESRVNESIFKGIEGISKVVKNGKTFDIFTTTTHDPRPLIFALAVKNNLTLITINEKTANVESIFHKLTSEV